MEGKEDLGSTTGHDVFVNKLSEEVRQKAHFIENPVGLRQLMEAIGERDFSGFREEKGNMRRIISVEKEIRCMRELISGILEKQDKLIMENKELKKKYSKCESALKINNEMKEAMEELKKENEILKCNEYEGGG